MNTRRAWLRGIAAGGAALSLSGLRQALAAGRVDEGVHRVRGEAHINGVAELVPRDDPKEAETVRTKHHDQPRYIYPKGMPRMIEAAPVVNHTDAELVLLESLVGRRPPFVPGKY